MKRYDVVVVGLGSMGSAAVAALAGRGARVLGVERFARGHTRGASSGRSRVIRRAYFEHPDYVPLLQLAYAGWRALERATGTTLLHEIGALLVGRPGSAAVAGTLRSAQSYDIPIACYAADELRARFPMFAPLPDEVGVYEACGGYLEPEAAVAAFLTLAETRGAQLAFETPVRGWAEAADDALTVTLEGGEAVRTRRLVLCTGAWTSAMPGSAGFGIRLQRNVQVWLRSAPAVSAGCPVFLVERAGEPAQFYGVPDRGAGFKVAFHGSGSELGEAAQLDPVVTGDEIAPLLAAATGWIPHGLGAVVATHACIYTLSPDRDFIVGRHPAYEGAIVAAGFSGHGFKFAPAIGDALADLALEQAPRVDLAFLAPTRFGGVA